MSIMFPSVGNAGSVNSDDMVSLQEILQGHEPFVLGFLKGVLGTEEEMYPEDHDEYSEFWSGFNYSGCLTSKAVKEAAEEAKIDLEAEYKQTLLFCDKNRD